MPAIIQPADLGQIVADFQRRLHALETTGTAALTPLNNSVVSVTQSMANALTPTAVPASNAAFTLTRQRRIMVCGTSSFFVNSGTSSYGYIYLAVVAGLGATVTDLDGKSGITGRQAVANNTAGSLGTTISGNGSEILTLRLPEGSYTAQFQYALRDGDSGWNLTTGSIDVYVMGG
jgi:hypothetical protein